jgi:hypothetical protein
MMAKATVNNRGGGNTPYKRPADSPLNQPIYQPAWNPDSVVHTAKGDVVVDSSGKAEDGSTPVAGATPVNTPVVPATPLTSVPTVTPTNAYAGNPPILGKDGFYYTQNANGDWVKGPQGQDTRNMSAMDDINSIFGGVGLAGLAAKAYGQWKQGIPMSEIMDGIQKSPEYAQRFPGMAALVKTGNRISESQYIAKEDADRSLMRQYLPAGTYDDTQSLGKLIGSNVSTTELQTRLQAAHDSVLSTDPTVVQALKDNYGLTQNDIAYWWLNPDKSLADIQRISNSSNLIAISQETGANINKTQAEGLNNQGIDAANSRAGFARVGMDNPLTQNLPGNEAYSASQQDLLDSTFTGNAAAQQNVTRARQQRTSQFMDGGGFSQDNQGMSGLGVASTQ